MLHEFPGTGTRERWECGYESLERLEVSAKICMKREVGSDDMRYDRSNVNTFLVVLTCRIQQPSKKFPQNSNTKCRYEFRNRVVGKKPWQLS